MARDRRGSEFGGSPGRIQPAPHDPADVPFETLGQIYSTEPAPLPAVEVVPARPILPTERPADDPQTLTPPTVRKR